jgi:hypothetical protein
LSYRSRIFAALLFTMAPVATCVAQSTTSFSVIPTSNNTSTLNGWTPQNIYAVDVNNDGIPDLIQDEGLASTNAVYSPTGTFGVTIANGDGTFKPAASVNYPPGVGFAPMAFGDFNGDGKIDIAIPIPGKNTLAIYLGNGNGTFVSPWYFNIPLSAGQTFAQFSPLVAADFNHDGKVDLAVVAADSTNTTVYVLPGAGTGVFSSAQAIFSAPTGINASNSAVGNMYVGDYDSDTNADIALIATVGSTEGGIASTTIHVLYGGGNFSFTDTAPYNQGGPLALGSGDLNSDGYTDLYALDTDSYRLATFYGQGGRTFASYFLQLPPASYSGADFMPALAMADFNDDGRMDLVTTVVDGQAAEVYMVFFLAGSSPGQFTTQTWNITPYSSVDNGTMPVVGDFNHDNKPDFALVSTISPGASTIYTGLNTDTQGLWSNCDYPATGRGIHVCSPDVSSGAAVNFNATSHSFGSLRKMELWVDGKKVAEQHHTWEGNASFSFSSTLAAGTHQGAIFAADVDDTLQLNLFNFTVPSSCSAPAAAGVHICAPVSGSTTAAPPVLVQATSTVTGTLGRMEVWVDSTKKYTETNSTSLSASIGMSAGKHTITVFAVNTSGTVWSQAVSVTVP